MLVTLPLFLKQLWIVTGPRKKHTSYSGLEVLRKDLMGLPQFQGGEEFFKFGNALHEVFLKNDYTAYKTLPKEQQTLVDTLVAKLNSHPVVKKLMEKSVREKKLKGYINGVKLAYILDIEQSQYGRGADLKTTACVTYADCVAKSVLYGYTKQRNIYKKVKNLKEFYFIFISKRFPHNIFIIGDKDFKPYEAYAEKELEFLLYFYKHYGRFVREGDQKETKTKSDMSKTKELMAEIVTASKEHKQSKVAVKKSKQQEEKTRKKVLALITKFPKKEAPLYDEKFKQIICNL